MTELVSSVADKIDRAVQRVTPLAYRVRRTGRRLMRRALRKPRSVSEGPNLLPLLIQVLASFTKADGVLLEEEIDSSLGFLRYDYPEAVYSELRQLFRQALYEQQDLSAMAQKLGAQLSTERKIMLGVQLYDLISQAGLKQEQVVAFYSFMSQLGMAAQAIDIVYQLNASEDADASIYQRGASPLESLSFGTNGAADVVLKSLAGADRLLAFRYHDLILLKNYTGQTISVRGRPLLRGGFCRIYPGQRILVGDQFLTYQELAAYFNAKKNVSLPQIFVRVHKDADAIRIDVGQFLRCNFSERIVEEERNIIRSLEVVDVNHRFSNSEVALEGISFTVNRGELVCVMGASGSGKSTLMKVLAGQLQPTSGQVFLNGQSLYQNLDLLKGYISYVPQE